jgi:pimeloyl-ACP methyl ester carboxylesterase
MITTVGISLAGVLVLLAVAALGYRKVCQRRAARALMIDSPGGIAESGYVTIGGIGQWLQIRGEDRDNPVLLFLHGSGMTMTPFTPVYRDWEKHFTVAQWDRRGTGRTLRRNGKKGDRLTFDLMAADGIEVAEYLCRRLHTDQVILVGHSQGSIVGVKMAQRRPDLFCAYVGTGQIADMARSEAGSYSLALERARALGSARAIRELERAGPPPYPTARAWLIKQRWSFETDPELRAWGKSLRMVLTAPHRSLRDVWLFNTAFMFYPQPLYEETMRWSAAAEGTRFAVPFFIFQGDADPHTLTSVAQEYFGAVEAPAKDLVLLPGGGHCAVLMQSGTFLAELRARACRGGAMAATAPIAADEGSAR